MPKIRGGSVADSFLVEGFEVVLVFDVLEVTVVMFEEIVSEGASRAVGADVRVVGMVGG